MEGYYWRVVDADAGSVIVVLCGICRGPNGPWAAVALAAHPAGFARHAVVAPAAAEPSTRPVPLGRRLDRPSRRGRMGRAAAAIRAAVAGTGLRRAPPRPCLARSRAVLASRGAGGQAEGEASLGGVRLCLDGATAYVEKNWGPPGFAGHRWSGRDRRLRRTGRGTWIAREGGPTSGREGPTRDVPPTPGRGRGIRLGGDRGGAHRRKRRRRGARQGRRPAPRRLGGRRSLRRAPGSAQGDR
jgi:hypothetical protein